MTHPTLDPDGLRSALEAAGWRHTRQRQAIYNFLQAVDGDHPTAEEVFQAVRPALPRLSLATVYKALEALVSSGLAAKLPPAVGDGSARYDARRDQHYHLRCLRSGRVADLPTPFDPDLVAKLDPDLAGRLQAQGFEVTGYRLELVGHFVNPGREGRGGESETVED